MLTWIFFNLASIRKNRQISRKRYALNVTSVEKTTGLRGRQLPKLRRLWIWISTTYILVAHMNANRFNKIHDKVNTFLHIFYPVKRISIFFTAEASPLYKIIFVYLTLFWYESKQYDSDPTRFLGAFLKYLVLSLAWQ